MADEPQAQKPSFTSSRDQVGRDAVGGDKAGRDHLQIGDVTIAGGGPRSISLQSLVILVLLLAAVFAGGLYIGTRVERASPSAAFPTAVSAALTAGEVPSTLSVDLASQALYPFNGLDNPQYGQGRGRLFVLRTSDTNLDYQFEYILPDQGYGYAGLAFHFPAKFDTTPYNHLEVTLSLGDDKANCDVYLKSGEVVQYIRICDGSFAGSDGDKNRIGSQKNLGILTVTIPLRSHFRRVDPLIDEVGFSVNTDFTRGLHSFTIHDVKFTK
jgi:hypothetical protein